MWDPSFQKACEIDQPGMIRKVLEGLFSVTLFPDRATWGVISHKCVHIIMLKIQIIWYSSQVSELNVFLCRKLKGPMFTLFQNIKLF